MLILRISTLVPQVEKFVPAKELTYNLDT